MLRYWTRNFLRWLCRVIDIQCSGKRRVGFGMEYCQKRALHDGVCVAYTGDEFRDYRWELENPETMERVRAEQRTLTAESL